MKKIVFINFGSTQFTHRQILQLFSAKFSGKANQAYGFRPKHLKNLGFYHTHPWAHSSQRGFAFWSWKPFIIYHTLQQVQNGDIVIYSDIGRPWVRLFSHSLKYTEQWLNELNQDIMPGVYIPYTGTIENWTKATTLKKMGATSSDILNSPPIQTSFSIWRKTQLSVQIAAEWEEKCQHFSLISDYKETSDIPNNSFYKEHRHDQAIFSILCFKHKIKALNTIKSQRPKQDKNLDSWLQLQNVCSSNVCTIALQNGLSATTKKIENIIRFCLRK